MGLADRPARRGRHSRRPCVLLASVHLSKSVSSALRHALTRQGTGCLTGAARADGAPPTTASNGGGVRPTTQPWPQGDTESRAALKGGTRSRLSRIFPFHPSPHAGQGLPRQSVAPPVLGSKQAPGTTMVPIILPRRVAWSTCQGPSQPPCVILFHPSIAQAVKGNDVALSLICLGDVAESGIKVSRVLAQSLN